VKEMVFIPYPNNYPNTMECSKIESWRLPDHPLFIHIHPVNPQVIVVMMMMMMVMMMMMIMMMALIV